MAKSHWMHADNTFGCQHSECSDKAVVQWQRDATDEEIHRELNLEGPYGKVHRNPTGPHRIAVFACAQHAHTPEMMAVAHRADCPSPDAGCECG